MDSESLKNDIIQHAKNLLGKDFEFREFQLEAVKQIVENAVLNVKHTLLEAPTGSGKSIIAILAAYVLYKVFSMKSYILVSDLSLYSQYENDIKKLNDPCFGYIKGKENYICWRNGCTASSSLCSLQGHSPLSLRHSRDFPCKYNCKYYKNYVKAVNSPITLMTYQFYFIQRNYVEDDLSRGNNKNFPERDLVIGDECHKICEICQTHFSPSVEFIKPKWMDTLDAYFHKSSDEYRRAGIITSMQLSINNDELIDAISQYEIYLREYISLNAIIREKMTNKQKLSKNERLALSAGNMARQVHCKFEDMLRFCKELKSNDYVVKTSGEDGMTFNFVFDDIMLRRYFHEKSKNELLMSATINNFNEYASIAGLDKKSCKAILLPSTFDFSRSPILISECNRMSYSEKEKSLANIAKETCDICNENKDFRGIIQTGSYANSDALAESFPKEILNRCLFYKGSLEKSNALEEFLRRGEENPNDNSILIGPTLIEGLNFPDNQCRFQICIKVPYACLGNEYIKKKMEYVDGWYEYDAINKICQGIGRGIRHEKDWCKTYILDGCIMNLVSKLSKIDVLKGRFEKYEMPRNESRHLTNV